MVAKRFFRNLLAIVGMVIIILMFLFSFVGGAVIPYKQSQVFYTTDEILKDYAGATEIDQYQFNTAEGAELPKDIYSKTMLAASNGKMVFESRNGGYYALEEIGEKTYKVYSLSEAPKALYIKMPEYKSAVEDGASSFVKDGVTYYFSAEKNPTFFVGTEIGNASMLSFTAYDSKTKLSYEFTTNSLMAYANGESSFEADGATYGIVIEGDAINVTLNGENYALLSNMNFNAVTSGVYLTPEYKLTALEAFAENATEFVFADADGVDVTYKIENKNGQYLIKKNQVTRVIDSYAAPSKEHWVGTDANGMDLLARLMYGGRISLLIGFVVIFIEVLIGTVIGGIAGFFGKWVDNLLMRLVDVIYCIPAMPLYLILGSIMDYYQAKPAARIYMLCIVMAVIGWVGIARIVRGQILSLREQEFMVAAEATGISTYRRIFKHLVPNVIPQLIVFASMGLGDVILSEATLSFLGLGIKYPAASWGSIINAVNDSYVMTKYVFVWLPAGLLILLTVLAFNFIGDGLRDAFDPKMKR
ncbi:MAG TPA: ABC transporter permease [Lachnospiraceae bacterium]|nr:ABC transporter permease [Lachnospiraceae bacterium]HBR05461.1 ABC transporter permease [Lachnospiraceae bacterium]HBZ89514.1 ABC transporter permease [Lachnospiraceae bacterium]